MSDPGQHGEAPKQSRRSEFVRYLGYAALAEIIVGMVGIGGLLDAPYVRSRPEYRQDAHKSLMSGVELFFLPADWTAAALDTGSHGLLYSGMRLVLALAAPTIVWGTGLFILKYSFRRFENTVDRLEAESQADPSVS